MNAGRILQYRQQFKLGLNKLQTWLRNAEQLLANKRLPSVDSIKQYAHKVQVSLLSNYLFTSTDFYFSCIYFSKNLHSIFFLFNIYSNIISFSHHSYKEPLHLLIMFSIYFNMFRPDFKNNPHSKLISSSVLRS